MATQATRRTQVVDVRDKKSVTSELQGRAKVDLTANGGRDSRHAASRNDDYSRRVVFG